MSRVQLNLHNPEDLKVISGQWRFASGLVPGEPNEGLVAQMKDSPARLADYDDSSWDIREDLSQWHSPRSYLCLVPYYRHAPRNSAWQRGTRNAMHIRDLYRRLRRGMD